MIENSEQENTYSLLSGNLDEIINATSAIREVLTIATKKIEDIKTKYPNVGIGDTETNENITEDFYDMLHWMKNELKDITD